MLVGSAGKPHQGCLFQCGLDEPLVITWSHATDFSGRWESGSRICTLPSSPGDSESSGTTDNLQGLGQASR